MNRNIWNPKHVSRRTFLSVAGTGLAASAFLAACGVRTKKQDELRAASKWFSDQTIVSDGGPQRTIWSFSDDDGNLGGLSPESIAVEVLDPDSQVTHSTTVQRHIDGVAMPYYPVIVPFQKPGVHEFRFDLGTRGNYVGFANPGLKSDSTIIWPGDRFPALVTPTLERTAGVDPICTRQPSCPFHDISLDDSILSERATVLIVSTPAFCGTKWMCGPVLENLVSEVGSSYSGFDVIHAEVYAAPSAQELGPIAPAVIKMGVGYEPFIFLLDEQGTVLRRLDHIWDKVELRELLSLI